MAAGSANSQECRSSGGCSNFVKPYPTSTKIFSFLIKLQEHLIYFQNEKNINLQNAGL